jgi:hypothetical protein
MSGPLWRCSEFGVSKPLSREKINNLARLLGREKPGTKHYRHLMRSYQRAVARYIEREDQKRA